MIPRQQESTAHSIEWGASRAMDVVLVAVERASAAPRTTVLIAGESGVGKELVARAIHSRSARAQRPFVAVNCASLGEGLLEAELFGYAAGAFTGALPGGRDGLFAAAEGGTILLDEIGELDLTLQARLLRVLQERTFRPVGSDVEQPMDVRILAATNRDLSRMVAEGRFREDLYYRLNVLSIRVPSLRDRREDVAPLALRFATDLTAEMCLKTGGFADGTLDRLARHAWPGNVRELRNVIERALVHSAGAPIAIEHLGLEESVETISQSSGMLVLDVADRSLKNVERALIERVLVEVSGNRSAAARALGVNRATLYNKLRTYDLSA
ncbi:MAG: sigma 54-interacting transcriptional regulator [Planctomycetota bacterium]|nr:sigma 54-interacting transcriptional regulator [Planctomycetota bacterium]